MTGSGTLAMGVSFDPSTETFSFRHVVNTTGDNVLWNDEELLVDVNMSGAYSLVFAATNFALADPPVEFEGGAPSWLVLQQGYDKQQFTLLLLNAGFELETSGFQIREEKGRRIDPTVVNNPNPPTFAAVELKPVRKLARA